MDVVQLAVDRLIPNQWNVNRMNRAMQKKLTAYLKREGLVEPLVVRPHPKELGHFEILGGFHRWEIAKELGYQTVPSIVVELDDRRAKVLSINLNEMKGQSLPSLLGRLIHDLSSELTLDDLETQLPYTLDELKNDSIRVVRHGPIEAREAA